MGLIRRETVLPVGTDREVIRMAEPDMIVKAVLDYYGFTITDVVVKSRARGLVEPRHLVHYFLTVHDISLRGLGVLTSKDHATVLWSRDTVEKWIEVDKVFRAKVQAIGNAIMC